MHYKTIIFELLQQRQEMYERLRKERMLLPAMEAYAQELKDSHASWTELLLGLRPGSDRSQIAGEALEMALTEIEERLPSASPRNESLSLEAAMAFVRRHSPLA